MVDDTADGIVAAGSGTGIAALLVDARQLAGTLRVDSALGAAVGSLAEEGGQARAGGYSINVAALGVWTAGCRHAGISQRLILGLNGWG